MFFDSQSSAVTKGVRACPDRLHASGDLNPQLIVHKLRLSLVRPLPKAMHLELPMLIVMKEHDGSRINDVLKLPNIGLLVHKHHHLVDVLTLIRNHVEKVLDGDDRENCQTLFIYYL
jgi:hypothetical protein